MLLSRCGYVFFNCCNKCVSTWANLKTLLIYMYVFLPYLGGEVVLWRAQEGVRQGPRASEASNHPNMFISKHHVFVVVSKFKT